MFLEQCSDKIQIFRGFQMSEKNKRFRDICEVREYPLKLKLNFNIVTDFHIYIINTTSTLWDKIQKLDLLFWG